MYEAIGPETTGILFGVQLGAMLLAAVYAFVFTILLVYITRPRLSARQQLGHIDYINHGEDAYAFDIEIPSEKEMEQYELADSSWHSSTGVKHPLVKKANLQAGESTSSH